MKNPVLRFNPTAWAKLIYYRDKSKNEVSGFGITSPDDLLYITDFVIIKQRVSLATVKFDDESVADFFDKQVDLSRKPEQFARIWLHTHPGDSPLPSSVDKDTFQRVFGKCQWAIMFILAQDNKVFTNLMFNAGISGNTPISMKVDYSRDFEKSNHKLWDLDYETNVEEEKILSKKYTVSDERGGGVIKRYVPLNEHHQFDEYYQPDIALMTDEEFDDYLSSGEAKRDDEYLSSDEGEQDYNNYGYSG